MAPKPTEVRLVASLLQAEAESADMLAKQIIESLDEKRDKDNDMWVIIRKWRTVISVLGPYSTVGAANRVATKLVSPGPDEALAYVVKVRKEEYV